jgi:AmiR/NasT family two-component response regulator
MPIVGCLLGVPGPDTLALDHGRHQLLRMNAPPTTALRTRVLIANDRPARIDLIAEALTRRGHEPIVGDASPEAPGPPGQVAPDVALVGRHGPDRPTLELVTRLVHEGSCPVVALLPERDPEYVANAARAGAFASVVGTHPHDLQAAIDVAMERFHQYRMLQDAFARRAVVEQAKGILMARNAIDADAAFDLLRTHARGNSKRVTDVAAAIVESHLLLHSSAVDETADAPTARP